MNRTPASSTGARLVELKQLTRTNTGGDVLCSRCRKMPGHLTRTPRSKNKHCDRPPDLLALHIPNPECRWFQPTTVRTALEREHETRTQDNTPPIPICKARLLRNEHDSKNRTTRFPPNRDEIFPNPGLSVRTISHVRTEPTNAIMGAIAPLQDRISQLDYSATKERASTEQKHVLGQQLCFD